MTGQNKRLASIFHDLATMYRFLGGENPFRAIAYEKASQSIHALPKDIKYYITENSLQEIPGIGTSLEKDIREFSEKGEIRRFERLKKRVPYGLMELMDIRGFGPQSLKSLHKKLHVESKEEVITALQDGSVSGLKGFGPKKVENMLRSLKLHKIIEDRMILWDAMQAGNRMTELLRTLPTVKRVELAGSLRRRKETVGDLDILAVVSPRDRKKVAEFFTGPKLAQKVLAKGDTRASILMKEDSKQADLRMVDESEWGAALQYFTGSKEHNIHLRTIAKNQGYKISEYGVFNIRSQKRIAGKTENEIYDSLGMQFVPPEMREDKGEVELALAHKLPQLVDLKDIRGDLQMHSDWSDGLHTLDEIFAYVEKNFRYDYIAMTDHSKSSRVAGGMDEKGFLKQIRAIKELNERMHKDFLKAGAEVDILGDGSLDLSDELLAQLDWVTASVHSGFTRDNTDRLIKACENPYVHCIGHPTGRIIGKRDPYTLRVSDIVRAAAKTGTALEINAQPDRMDMNDNFASEVRKSGAKIVISTDSHKLTDFDFMRLGVDIARRAWCTKENILNTRTWKDVKHFISKKRK